MGQIISNFERLEFFAEVLGHLTRGEKRISVIVHSMIAKNPKIATGADKEKYKKDMKDNFYDFVLKLSSIKENVANNDRKEELEDTIWPNGEHLVKVATVREYTEHLAKRAAMLICNSVIDRLWLMKRVLEKLGDIDGLHYTSCGAMIMILAPIITDTDRRNEVVKGATSMFKAWLQNPSQITNDKIADPVHRVARTQAFPHNSIWWAYGSPARIEAVKLYVEVLEASMKTASYYPVDTMPDWWKKAALQITKNTSISVVEQLAASLSKLFPGIKPETWADGENPNDRWLTLMIPNENEQDKKFCFTIMFDGNEVSEISIHEYVANWEPKERLGAVRR